LRAAAFRDAKSDLIAGNVTETPRPELAGPSTTPTVTLQRAGSADGDDEIE
jgi:hypothetical protein